MEILVMVSQLMLGLSILVGLHEFGHLIAAKAFGMRVEKFSIGFPPKIWGFKYGATEYSIGAVPLGGFVKITGMIDESLDTKSLSSAPDPWEFRAKPAWQRLIVMLGGIIVNVLTGIVIFVWMIYASGESYIPKSEINQHGIVAYELGKKIGFETGDKILNINGENYDRFSELISPKLLLADSAYYTVERAGQVFKVYIPEGFINEYSDKKYENKFIRYRFPFTVKAVMAGSEAARGGLQAGDQFLTINQQPIRYFDQLQAALTQNKDEDITAVVKTKNQHPDTLQLHVTTEGTLGFYPEPKIKPLHDNYTLAQAIPKGTARAFNIVWVNMQGLAKIFTGEVDATKSIGGPIKIAQMFGGTWHWNKFWRLTGLLSMILAFMNFLPIPALDGGHVMFLTYEIVAGRQPSEKFLVYAQKVGMVILISIMAFAFFNDILQTLF